MDEPINTKLLQKQDDPGEIALLKRIAKKDAIALSELYDIYSKILFSVIFRIIQIKEEAEEVLQEAFMKIWQNAGRFDDSRGRVFSWLTAIAHNLALDRLKSKNYRQQIQASSDFEKVAFHIEDKSDTPLDALLVSERAKLVNHSLDRLPAEQKIVIKMSYLEGLSQSEIANNLEIPLGTVKTRMLLGMKKLRNELTGIMS